MPRRARTVVAGVPRDTVKGSGPSISSKAMQGIEGGMSGSPIVNDGGEAIGIIEVAGGTPGEIATNRVPQARLAHHFPGWLLRALQ